MQHGLASFGKKDGSTGNGSGTARSYPFHVGRRFYSLHTLFPLQVTLGATAHQALGHPCPVARPLAGSPTLLPRPAGGLHLPQWLPLPGGIRLSTWAHLNVTASPSSSLSAGTRSLRTSVFEQPVSRRMSLTACPSTKPLRNTPLPTNRDVWQRRAALLGHLQQK